MMDEKLRPMKKAIYAIPVLLLLAWLISLTVMPVSTSLAQTDSSTWSPPVNLSQSGGTMNSTSVQDSTGRIHVVWNDAASTVYYTRTNDNSEDWISPVITNFPFSTNRPNFFATEDGFIHAFWLGERGQLFHSRTPADAFGLAYNWESSQALAEAALSISVDADENGNLFLAYVRPLDTQEAPAGIYIRRLPAGSSSWSSSTNLYASRYLRNISSAQANVDVLAKGGSVLVSWDVQPRKQILSVISLDNGVSWSEPNLVVGPDPISPFNLPFNVMQTQLSGQMFRIWEFGQPGITCERFFQVSLDHGANWSDPLPFLPDMVGCAHNIETLIRVPDTLLLMLVVQGNVFFTAWDGDRWSDPIIQTELSGFIDPETYDLVELNCYKLHITTSSRIIIIGCDNGSGKDIWATGRTIEDIGEWFPEESNWKTSPGLISTGNTLSSPLVFVDSSGKSYAIWTEAEYEPVQGTTSNTQKQLFFASWDGERWSTPTRFNHIPNTWGDYPTVAIERDGRVHLVWQVNPIGTLYYSWTSTNQSITLSDWSNPDELPLPEPGGTKPSINVDSDGNIYVVYTVPANESRGIYLITSGDSGRIWSEPKQIFNGAEAGWQIVGKPQIAINEGGIIHVLFTQETITGLTRSLHYLLSNDRGETWSSLYTVVEDTVIWSQITGFGQRTVHRAWIAQQAGNFNLFQEFSLDGGQIWQQPSGLFSAGEGNGPVLFTWDLSGRLHFFRIIADQFGSSILRHQTWTGDNWGNTENLNLSITPQQNIAGMSAMISPNGYLAVLYFADAEEVSGNRTPALAIASNLLEMPDTPAIETTLESEIVFPTPSPTPDESDSILPTPTLDLNLLQSGIEQDGLVDNSFFGVIIGSILAIVVVAIPFGIHLMRTRNRR
jgi:hypothetical protein